jgi:Cd(II)/Pb(II)-responsive transcriptional regulator
MSGNFLKIGELAKETGTPIETIRYYERAGLLPAPTRSAGNYRLYTEPHRDRLQFIRRCRSLDMALDEVRTLLSLREAQEAPCAEVNDLLDRHIGTISARIVELRLLQRQLTALRSSCRSIQAIEHCEILKALSN